MDRIKFVFRHPRRAYYSLIHGRGITPRFVYTVDNVAPQGPLGNLIAYLDRESIRQHLVEVSKEVRLHRALEVACGYGRVIMTLAEFAEEVIGIEREPALVETARSLLPDITFHQQDSILRLPTIDDASCDFVMTFTVLQHMVDEDVRRVIDEIKRVTRPGGFILLGEKVAPGNETERTDDRTLFLSRHRPVPVYQEWMAPFTLRSVRPRPAPPAWARNSGALMFFRHEP